MGLSEAVLTGVLVLAVAGFIYAYKTMLAQKRGRFRDRPDMTPDEFYTRFYAASGLRKEAVVGILKEVSAGIDVPVTKLRPEDRFTEELKPVRGWEFDDGLAALGDALSRRAKRLGVAVDLTQIRTLDDYIRIRARP